MRHKLTVLAHMIVMLLIGTTMASAGQSYPMNCLGGADMTAEVTGGGGMTSAERDKVVIRFQRTRAGSAARPVRAGECAWVDRGFRPAEPGFMTYTEPSGSRHPSYICRAGRCTPVTNPRSLRFAALIHAVYASRPFQVKVYYDATKRSFIITDVIVH